MVRMRLKRMGGKKRPVYRVVVADSRSPRDGRFIEEIGYYDPIAEPTIIKFQEERVAEWLRRGAQPSERVQNLLQRAGLTATPAGEVADA